MKEKTSRDLTEFFLEWRDTCTIDKCEKSAASGDVQYVHDEFDKRLQGMINRARASGLGNGVLAASEFSGADVHAFKLVESEFYRPGKKTEEAGGKKFGQALKDHLFGNEKTKFSPGRLNKYFLDILRSVVKDSFKNSVISVPVRGKDGTESNPVDDAPDQKPNGNPTATIARSECIDDFRESLLSFWNKASIDMRLAALCFATDGEVPFSNPIVVEASGLRSSAFSNRKERVILELRKIAGALSEDHDPNDLRFVFDKFLRGLLEEFGREDPACAPFFEVA